MLCHHNIQTPVKKTRKIIMQWQSSSIIRYKLVDSFVHTAHEPSTALTIIETYSMYRKNAIFLFGVKMCLLCVANEREMCREHFINFVSLSVSVCIVRFVLCSGVCFDYILDGYVHIYQQRKSIEKRKKKKKQKNRSEFSIHVHVHVHVHISAKAVAVHATNNVLFMFTCR